MCLDDEFQVGITWESRHRANVTYLGENGEPYHGEPTELDLQWVVAGTLQAFLRGPSPQGCTLG